MIAAFAVTNGNDDDKPAASGSSSPSATRSTPSQTPSQTPSETTPARVIVNSADYVGLSVTDAEAKLAAAGLTSRVEDGDAAPTADKANTVEGISPTGSLAPAAWS